MLVFLLHIIAVRIRNHLENELPPEQAGFRRGKRDKKPNWQFEEFNGENREFQQPLYLCFIYYSKAFDCVLHRQLWRIMKEMGFPEHVTDLICSLYHNQEATVRTDSGDSQVSVGGRKINNLRYADDTTLIAKSSDELQDLNVKKTKIMICGGDTNQQVKVNGEDMEQVDTFNFLGSLIDNAGGSLQEIGRRLAMARSSAIALTDIWKDISKATKIHGI
ncbi:uncharacterized protein [Amphiura filiformis]|uniref:uncharacterized protein n=1 Tax=Amphiura filiformis TaxID=82378 RepID=UPI003B20E2AF